MITMQPLSGNHKQQTIISHCLHNASLPHSLLFSGLEGIGKKTFAMTLAKMMFCKNNACNTCPSCLQIEHGIHPDVIVMGPNDKGTIPIGNDDEHEGSIRWLIARISLAPVNNCRVVIINDAHTMNMQAQNALLKTIEEPPHNNFIILISSERNQLLPTIRSRITEYVFNPLSQEELTAILVHNGVSHEKHNAILAVASGSASYALILSDDTLYAMIVDAYRAIVNFVIHPEVFSHDLLPLLQALGPYKTIDLLINIFRLHCGNSFPSLPWFDSYLKEETAVEIIKILLELRRGLSHNINIRMALKGMLYSLCFSYYNKRDTLWI